MLAYTFSLLVGVPPAAAVTRAASAASVPSPSHASDTTDGGKISPVSSGNPTCAGRVVWNAALRRVRKWLCPQARLQRYWQRWSNAPPPHELAALLDHVARSLPLDAPATAPAAPT